MIILFYYKNSLLSPLTSSPEGTQPARWETSPQSPQPESADPLGSHSLLPHGFRRPGFAAQDRAFQKAPTLLSLESQPIRSGKKEESYFQSAQSARRNSDWIFIFFSFKILVGGWGWTVFSLY